jgi:pimeloyl-ACP methyl ester carboxylesterase
MPSSSSSEAHVEIAIRGHRCVYDQVGSGPDLVLLHSVGLSTREGWREQIEALSRHFRVLTFDIRGLGQSERGAGSLGVATFAADLEVLLQSLKISRAALAGVSLGGFVAQAFALQRPEMVSALVLVSTTCRIPVGNAQRRAERNARIRASGMAAAVDHQIASHFPPEFAAVHPDAMDWYKRHYLANDPESYIEIMDDLGRFDACDRLKEIRCPTLIVAGDQDATSVAGRRPLDSATALHEGIAGSELFVIQGANHYPQLDHAAAFNARVILFLQKAPAEAR